MRRARSALALAAFAVALTGCGGGDTASSSSPSPSQGAGDAVAQAVEKTTKSNFRLTMVTDGDEISGLYDATSKGYSMSGPGDQGGTLDVIFMSTDMFIRGLQGRCAAKWVHFDLKSLNSNGQAPPVDSDPLSGLAFLRTINSVERVGDGRFEGTLDLTKAVEGGSPAEQQAVEQMTRKLGDKAKHVPFEADVNADGYLSRYKITMPGNAEGGKDEVIEMDLSEFGTTATVQKPATGITIEAAELFSGRCM